MNEPIVKPMHNLYVWRSDWGVVGQQLEMAYINFLIRHSGDESNVFVFNGRSAICRVLALDSSITRGEALKFATHIIEGKFWIGNFNLDRCVVDWKRSIEQTPRH